MKIQIAVIALYVIASASQTQADENPKIYCGRFLAEKMAQICDYTMGKRSSGYDYGYFNKMGWFGPGSFQTYSGMKVKRDPGIIEACCEQPCDISTLMEYC